MLIDDDGQYTLPSSSVALRDMVMGALDAPRPVTLGGNNPLPAGSVDLPRHNLVIAVTPLTERLFDAALVSHAAATGRDVVLIRAGLHPEILNPVRLDVALRSSCGSATLAPDLSFWRGFEGSLHLVPERRGLYLAVTADGLEVRLTAPWNCIDERSDGLTRAAAEIVRHGRRSR